MPYQTIIFDWDGTLAMTLHLWLAGYRQSLQAQQHTFPDSIIARDFFYEHDQGAVRYPEIDFDRMLVETRAYVLEHLSDLELYPQAKEVLAGLKAEGITMALVSSSSRRLVETGLSMHGLSPYFSSIICGDDVSKHKPDPMAFRLTLEALEASAADTLIIGDAKTDILAGHAAGAQTCLFTPPDNELFYDFAELRTSKPTYEIATLKGLTNL